MSTSSDPDQPQPDTEHSQPGDSQPTSEQAQPEFDEPHSSGDQFHSEPEQPRPDFQEPQAGEGPFQSEPAQHQPGFEQPQTGQGEFHSAPSPYEHGQGPYPPDQGQYGQQGQYQAYDQYGQPQGAYDYQQSQYQAGSGQHFSGQAQYQQQGQYQDPQGQYWANQEQYGQQGQYQQPGQYGQQAGWIPAGPQQPLKRNTLGIVALVAAIVGFIFAVWEGAFVIGWILLPIAFVVSLVALFQRGQGKKLAITALIISIVGTIAGAVAFIISASASLDELIQPSNEVVEVTEDPAGEETDEKEETEDPKTKEGSRENPHPIGTTIASDEWEVTVNSFTRNATDEVMKENEFNDEPDDGEEYVLVNLTAERLGEKSASPYYDIDVDYVTEGGNVISSLSSFAIIPDELSSAELYAGATATGNVSLIAPEDDDGTIRIRPGFMAEEVFFTTE